MSEHYLKALFDPTSVVVIGASETDGTQAAIITKKLQNQFTGKLYFVNPKHQQILDNTSYKKVTDIKEPIDLAVIVSPMKTVKKVIQQCAEQGIFNVQVATKFPHKYRGEVTKAMKSLRDIAKAVNVRLLGPNVNVLIRPSSKLNISTTNNIILPGKLALVSRSNTICNSIIDWAETEQVGFSSIIARGASVDVDLADIIDFLASDYRTNSIIVYLTHVQHPRRFMSALRAAAKLKPVVILKSSHENGSYSDIFTRIPNIHVMHEVFLTAILRAGADHVSSLTHLFAAAKILGSDQRTKGDKLAIISNGVGPVMLANDSLRSLGIPTAVFSQELVTELKSTNDEVLCFDNAVVMPDHKGITDLYTKNTQSLLANKDVDAVAIFLAPSAMIDREEIATEIAKLVKRVRKPVLAVWLGSHSGGKGRNVLIQEKVSNYRTPEAAIDAFSFLCHHFANRQRLLQVPFPLKKMQAPRLDAARELIQVNLKNKNNVLSKPDLTTLLEAFHIKCNLTDDAEESLFPVSARQLKVCIFNGPDFGPVISLGLGGKLSLVFKNNAIQLPPLNQRLSEDLINAANIDVILNDDHNLAQLNREQLRDLLMRVSDIAVHLPEVFELTLNALLIDDHRVEVSDAQVVVRKVKKGGKLFSHLVIHPYPSDWHRHIVMKDNQQAEVRPIRAEDAQAEVDFVENMSKESKYFRFMHAVKALTPEMLANFTKLDYDREMAFGAFMQKDEGRLLGVSRYVMNPDRKSCEFSIVVDEKYQGLGLARQLMLILIEHVKDHDLKVIEGMVLKNNTAMDQLMKSLGFKKSPSAEDHDINIYKLEYSQQT